MSPAAELTRWLDPRLARPGPRGLRPHPLPIPYDVLEDALLVFLAKLAVHRGEPSLAPPGARYRTIEHLLLAEARPVRANLNAMSLPDMPLFQCFTNAYRVAQAGPWCYAEGYALMCGAAEPFHHAWLVGPDGQIEDPTWRPLYRAKRREQPGLIWSGNVVYFGVSIDAAAHRRWVERHLLPNLLAIYEEDIPETLRLGPAAFLGEAGAPAAASAPTPNPAALPEAAGVAAGSKVESGTTLLAPESDL